MLLFILYTVKRVLNSICEKCTIRKISMLIIFTVLGSTHVLERNVKNILSSALSLKVAEYGKSLILTHVMSCVRFRVDKVKACQYVCNTSTAIAFNIICIIPTNHKLRKIWQENTCSVVFFLPKLTGLFYT